MKNIICAILAFFLVGCTVIGASIGRLTEGQYLDAINFTEFSGGEFNGRYFEIYFKNNTFISGKIKSKSCQPEVCEIILNDVSVEKISLNYSDVSQIKIEKNEIKRTIIGASIGAALDILSVMVILDLKSIHDGFNR